MAPPSPPIAHLRFSAAWNGTALAGVSRVSGLRRMVDVVEFRESTATGALASTKVPGDVSFEPVTIERSVTGDAAFAALADAAAAPVHGGDYRGTLAINLHDHTGRLVLTCTLHRAWVSTYDVFAGLEANGAEPVIERITVVYESWQLAHAPPP